MPGTLPEGVFEVQIAKPLGIQFEEDGPVPGKNGVSVTALVDGGNAAKAGDMIQVGDKLVGVTAVQFVGAKWERKMFDARKMDFDTVLGPIGMEMDKFVFKETTKKDLKLNFGQDGMKMASLQQNIIMIKFLKWKKLSKPILI